MSNTFPTALVPRIIGKARQVLSQSMALASVCNRDYQDAGSNIGQSITIGIPASLTAEVDSVAAVAPTATDITATSATLTIDQSYRSKPFAVTQKEVMEYDLDSLLQRQVDEAVRSVIYQINSSVWSKYYQVGYAIGTAGTGQFTGGNLNTFTLADRALFLNGVPQDASKVAILNYTDYMNVANTSYVYQAYSYGGNDLIKDGKIPQLYGFEVFRDQQALAHTTGSGTNVVVSSGQTPAVGDTTLVCSSTTAIAWKQGDMITAQGYDYSLQSAVTQATTGTSFTITVDRGLEAAPAAGASVAIDTNYSAVSTAGYQNLFGDPMGLSIVTRLPESPNSDLPTLGEHYPVTDEKTGLTILLSIFPQYGQTMMTARALWGVSFTDPRRFVRGYSRSTL